MRRSIVPGAPAGVTLKPLGLNEAERSIYGLSLNPAAGTQASATLVLPAGTFKPGRTFELQGSKPRNLRLSELIERGADFERVAFEMV